MPNTQLLTLQSNGASNNGVFIDNSRFNNIIARNGDVTNGTFSPYGDNWSVYFNGSSSLSITPTSSLNLGNTYTYEMWVNIPTGTSNKQILGGGSTKMLIGTGGSSSTVGVLRFYDGTSVYLGDAAYLIANDKWNHIAVVRESTGTNGFKMYVNGILVYVGTNGSGLATPPAYTIGGYNSSTDLITGYVSNLRISNSAMYTTSSTTIGTQVFTPSTAPLNSNANTLFLTCISNKFQDLSPLNYAVTVNGSPVIQKFTPFGTVTVPKYYSTYFNGSSDYLTVPATSTAFGTNLWTIECWVYLTSLAAATVVFDTRSGTSPNNGVQCSIGTDGSVTWFEGSATNIAVSSAGVITTNAWYHIAFVRSSTTTNGCAIYINGTSVKTGTSNLSHAGYITYIGRNAAAAQNYTTGYISNFRVVNGSAVVPPSGGPTSPVSAVANTSLLTCQNNTLIDNSLNNFTITAATTTVKPLPVSPFTPTANTGLIYSPTTFGGSMYFDGAGDYLAVTNNPVHSAFGTNNFTIEFYFYHTSLPAAIQYIISHRLNNYAPFVFWTASGTLTMYASSTNSSWDLVNGQSLGTMVANQWYHLAYTRNGNTFRVFLNGIQVYTFSSSNSLTTPSSTLNIGMSASDPYPFFGYITDVRVINGTSLYNSNFYPSSVPLTPISYINNRTDLANTAHASLLLSGTSTGIIDQTRTNNLESFGDAKVVQGVSPYSGNYYSALFNGSTDYLTLPTNAGYDFGSGDFTIEAWINPSALASSRVPISTQSTGGASGWSIFLFSSGYIGFDVYESSTEKTITASTTALTVGTWYHIAITRASGTIRMFVNGVVQTFSGTQASNINSATGLTLGRQQQSGYTYDFNGYISNVRIIKGNALYTSAFTPSSTPLAAVSGTIALLCQSNKFVDNSSNTFTVTINGTPKVQTQNPFQVNSGQSYYFDGTSPYDYLQAHTGSGVLYFGTGDFTMETWVYFSSNNGQYNPFLRLDAGTCEFGYDWSTTQLKYNTNVGVIAATWTPKVGQWYHVAIVRSGGVAKAYVDGANITPNQTGVVDSYNHNYMSTSSFYKIGGSSFNAAHVMYGYLSDLRVTKGVARYTSNNTSYLNSGSPYMTK